MNTFLFETEQVIPRPRDEVFAFFADATNLQSITPPWLQFHIETLEPIRMGTGVMIDYRLRVRGIPLRWRTRINVWEPPHRFVDEQIRGPYRLWVHEHTFDEVEGGTLIRDRVRYAVIGGALVNRLVVRRDVERIFAYRAGKLEVLFAPVAASDASAASASQSQAPGGPAGTNLPISSCCLARRRSSPPAR